MKTIKIDTDGNISVAEIGAFAELRPLLNGWPEHVRPRRLRQPFCMMADEEGLLENLPNNMIGSYLYETDKHGCPIVGDIYLMKDTWGSFGYDTVGLTENDINVLLNDINAVRTELLNTGSKDKGAVSQ